MYFEAGVYLSEAQNAHTSPLTHLFTQGRVEELNQREGYRVNSWVENTNMTVCISSLKILRTPAAKSLCR